MKKIVLLALVLVLLSTAVVVMFVRPVVADGTIYIRADGSIEGTTDISTVDNVTYTFTSNIFNQSIIVERDNIVVDGAGYALQGTGSGTGIDLTGRSNVTLKNVEVTNFKYGIYLESSSNNVLTGNNASSNNDNGIYLSISSNNVLTGNTASNNGYAGITLGSSSNNVLTGNTASNNDNGILLVYSSNTLTGNTASNNSVGIYLSISSNSTLTGNTASNNGYFGIYLHLSSNNVLAGNTASSNTYEGIRLDYSGNNILTGNNASNNDIGIYLRDSSNNTLFHNNLIDNTFQANVTTGYVNTWDDGYPSGGNYWSDYNGTDANQDGIGDTSYIIDANNTDRYPLMAPFSTFDAGVWNGVAYNVDVVSNSTVSDFYFNSNPDNPFISFNVTDEGGTVGFCRVTIPKSLLWVEDGWTLYVGDEPITDYTIIPDENDTYLYFTYNHTTKTVLIEGTHVIPEFPTWTSMLLLLIVLTVAVAIYKRRLLKTPIH